MRIVAWCLLLGGGCSVGDVDLEGKRCPCVAGWTCDVTTGLCVRSTVSDAGRRDSSGDRDAGMPSTDAGAPTDGGAERDASSGDDGGTTPDAGGADAGPLRVSHRWSRIFGTRGTSRGRGVAVDSAGNAYVAGNYDGTPDFGGGPLTNAGSDDIFVASFDSAGSHRWSMGFGSTAQEFGHAIALDEAAGRVYVAGACGGITFGSTTLVNRGDRDACVGSLRTSDGAPMWAVSIGSSANDQAQAVAVGGGGAVYVSGFVGGPTTIASVPLAHAGMEDVFVARLDSDGSERWGRTYGSAMHDSASALAAGVDGVYVAGSMGGAVDFGGGTLAHAGQFDAYVLALTTDGVHRWSTSFGGADYDEVYGIAVDDAQAVITGYVGDGVDLGGGPLAGGILVASFSTGGAHRWSMGPGAGYGLAIDHDASGILVVAGALGGTADFGGGALTSAGMDDGFVVAMTPGGAHRASVAFGGTEADVASGVAVAPGGYVAIAGGLASTADLGGGVLVPSSPADILAAGLTLGP